MSESGFDFIKTKSIIKSSLIVGAVGDIILQILVKNSSEIDSVSNKRNRNLWGLASYFAQHGSLESIFIASSMMAWFNWLYSLVDPQIQNKIGFVGYGMVLDIIFRLTHTTIMPSLDAYYNTLSPIMSMIWAAIPQILVLFYQDFVYKTKSNRI